MSAYLASSLCCCGRDTFFKGGLSELCGLDSFVRCQDGVLKVHVQLYTQDITRGQSPQGWMQGPGQKGFPGLPATPASGRGSLGNIPASVDSPPVLQVAAHFLLPLPCPGILSSFCDVIMGFSMLRIALDSLSALQQQKVQVVKGKPALDAAFKPNRTWLWLKCEEFVCAAWRPMRALSALMA